MKNSGIEWIGDIPDDWDVQRLKDIFYIIGGCGFKDSFQGNKYGDYPFCKASDINGAYAYLDSAKNYVNNDLVDSQHYKLIPESSILIAKIGEAMKKNHRKINLVKCIVDNNCQALCRKGDDNIKYLFYLLSQIDMAWFDNGGTIPNINNTKLLNFYVPFISVLSQKNIVTLLDKKCAAVDRLIENQSKQIEKLKEYKQSVITDAVTKGLNPSVPMKESGIEWIGKVPMHWKICRVKNVFSLRNERNFKELSEVNLISLYTDKGVVQHSDLIETTGNRAVNADGYKIVKKDDIVVNIILCWMGAIGKSEYDGVTSPAYDVYKPNKSVCVQYYHYLFRTKNFNAECYRYGRGIMMMRWRTYSTEFSAIGIPFPSIEEQREIADYLDKKCEKIDKLIALKQQKIEKLNEYKKSLIYEYVTGKKEVN